MRHRAVLSTLAVALASLLGLLQGSSHAASSRQSFATGLLSALNTTRAAHGLAPLVASPKLRQAANQHSREMLAAGYFAHESADGSPFWQRIQTYYPNFQSVGENLFWASSPITVEEAVAAWMASPEHRANILDPTWKQIGIGSVSNPSPMGEFGSNPVTVITTDFGTPKSR